MADPVTMMVAAVAAQAVGKVIEGNAQNNAAKANAGIADENARIAQQQAGSREDQQRRQSRYTLGAQAAATAEAGVDAGSGSAARSIGESAANAELDALNIRYEGLMHAHGFAREAALERARGKQARNAGYLGAATSILSGASQAYGMKVGGGSASGGGGYYGGSGMDNVGDRWGRY